MGNGVAPVDGGGAKTGAKYTEAEWQQMILGMKREHRENIEKLRKEQDEALFKASLSTLLFYFLIFFLFLSSNLSFIHLSDCPRLNFDKSQCKLFAWFIQIIHLLIFNFILIVTDVLTFSIEYST